MTVAGLAQPVEGQAEDLRHLGGVWPQGDRPGGDQTHHGRHPVTADGPEGAHLAQDLYVAGVQADLLLGLAQGGGHGVPVARVRAPAGKGYLAAMAVLFMLGAADK